MPLKELLWLMIGVALLFSAVTDLATQRISNWVTLPALALALGLRALWNGLGDLDAGLISGLVGASLMAGVLGLAKWAGQGFEGGDIKLMAAVGAALGYPQVISALVFISLTGAAQAVVTLLWHGAVWQTLSQWLSRAAVRLGLKPSSERRAERRIPYSVAIALGTAWSMWWERSSAFAR